MRFKTQLGLHPAWGRSVHVPAALLTHYRALGLDNNTLLYVLQIITAYWRGEEANHTEIATVMGCSDRVLRKYNAQLQEQGLAVINGRYLHGNRLENDYDLTPLLDAAALLDQTNQQQQQAAEKNAYRIVQSLVNALETGEDVSGLLADLAREWREKTLTKDEPTGTHVPVETGTHVPVETGTHVPVETGTHVPVETGTHVPVETGTHVPVSIGTPVPNGHRSSQPERPFRLKQERPFLSIDDDDQCINEINVNESSSSLITSDVAEENPVNALLQLKGKNGQRFDRQAASYVAYTAVQRFGEDAAWVINAWCSYAKNNKAITNAPGFVRVKIESGEWPPEPEPEPTAYNIPPELEGIIKR